LYLPIARDSPETITRLNLSMRRVGVQLFVKHKEEKLSGTLVTVPSNIADVFVLERFH